jgi:glutathione S-transferase
MNDASTLTLYHSNASPNARRVRTYLAEKGLAPRLAAVDLSSGAQHGDAYLAINPRRQVPALVLEDGSTIAEVTAIWRYFEERFPEPALLGATPKDKALVTMWERRAELDGFAAVMEAIRNSAPGLKGRALSGPHDYEQIPALAERSRLRVRNFLADLDARLREVRYLAGDAYSVADITALAAVDFAAKAIGEQVREEHAALRRWYAEVAARPSATA